MTRGQIRQEPAWERITKHGSAAVTSSDLTSAGRQGSRVLSHVCSAETIQFPCYFYESLHQIKIIGSCKWDRKFKRNNCQKFSRLSQLQCKVKPQLKHFRVQSRFSSNDCGRCGFRQSARSCLGGERWMHSCSECILLRVCCSRQMNKQLTQILHQIQYARHQNTVFITMSQLTSNTCSLDY